MQMHGNAPSSILDHSSLFSTRSRFVHVLSVVVMAGEHILDWSLRKSAAECVLPPAEMPECWNESVMRQRWLADNPLPSLSPFSLIWPGQKAPCWSREAGSLSKWPAIPNTQASRRADEWPHKQRQKTQHLCEFSRCLSALLLMMAGVI